MKIRRFFARTARDAIRQVREEQGPDSVILSNRRLGDGVEIVAALDYDETLVHETFGQPCPAAVDTDHTHKSTDKNADNVNARAEARPADVEGSTSSGPPRSSGERLVWSQEPTLMHMRTELTSLRELVQHQLSGLAWNDFIRRQPLRASILRTLTNLGISSTLAKEIVGELPADGDVDDAWRQSLGVLAKRLPIAETDLVDHGGVIAIIGPTGVGKTTTVAKLAARYVMRHGTTGLGLISTDGYRIGSQEQLVTFGKILGVGVQIAADAAQLREALGRFHDRTLILIDTAGMSQRDARLKEQLGLLDICDASINILLTLSANAQMDSLSEAIREFGYVQLDGAVITKLDEAATLGTIFSALIQSDLPICYVADGQRVPEDIRAANTFRDGLISQAVMLSHQHHNAIDEGSMAERFAGKANA